MGTMIIYGGAILVLGAIALGIIVKKLLYICGPNEVLIFSGKKHRVSGRMRGYHAIKGGRAFKVPMFEVVDMMDLTNMIINVSVKGAFSKGGIPLNVDGVANVKIGGEGELLDNAVERLLGKSRAEIIEISKETLEGNLRGVLAKMTPEEVNSDKITFAKQLMEEADQDLHRLGIELDTLKIQNVSDERGYLDSIGRISGAEIRKKAAIAEAQNKQESIEKDAQNVERAELARIQAAIDTMRAQTDRQVADAETQQQALVAASRGEILAAVVEAKASLEVQKARIEQVKRQLEADIIAPAHSQMEAAINGARGDAAKIVEDGKATAEVLRQITRGWKQAGANARDVFLMQKLNTLVATVSSTVESVQVDKVTVLGSGGNGNADLAGKVIGASEQIKAALGVDVLGALQQRLAGDQHDVRDARDTVPHHMVAKPPPAPRE